MALTLAEVVQRAFRDNPGLVDARLGRPLQEYDLELAEKRFRPELSFGAAGLGYRFDRGADSGDYRITAGPRLDMRLPIGGAVGISPTWSATQRDAAGGAWADSANLGVTFSQPLLKGGGLRIGRASVARARIAEERYILQFKAAAMDVVTLAIAAYRALIQAELQVQINERALQRAGEILEIKKLLVETGRMARRDIVQTQADIARQELYLLRSRNRLEDARRNLNVLLDLDAGARVDPVASMTFEPSPPDLGRSMELARGHHTGYLLAQLDLRDAEIELVVAENGTLWDLSVTGSASFGGGTSFTGSEAPVGLNAGREDYALDLVLKVPLGDTAAKAAERTRLAARIAYRRAGHALATASREMEIDVHNAVRTVDAHLQEMSLARQALAFAEETLEIEQEKLRLGLSSAHRLTIYQNALVDAQVNDLDARIRYLNAVAALDRTVGTVLDTWGIDIGWGAE